MRIVCAALFGLLGLFIGLAGATWGIGGSAAEWWMPLWHVGPAFQLGGPLAMLLATPRTLRANWGVFPHALAGAAGTAPYWVLMAPEGGWVAAAGVVSGAILGALFPTALRIWARGVSQARGASLAVLTLAGVVVLVATSPELARPYGDVPESRPYYAAMEYLRDNERELARSFAVGMDEAVASLRERWPQALVGETPVLAGTTLQAVLETYISQQIALDPEWAFANGYIEGAGRLTRHDDDHVVRRLRLQLALFGRLQGEASDEADQIRARIVSDLLLMAEDYRSEVPVYALDFTSTVVGILDREDLPVDQRRRLAASALRGARDVIGDYRSRLAPLPEFMKAATLESCADALKYLESVKTEHPGDPELRTAADEAIQAVTAFGGDIDSLPTTSKRARVGVGARAYRSILAAEGEERQWHELIAAVRKAYELGMEASLRYAPESGATEKRYSYVEFLEAFRQALAAYETHPVRRELFPDVDAPLRVKSAAPGGEGIFGREHYRPYGYLHGPPGGTVFLLPYGYDAAGWDPFWTRDLARHEAIPGHHLQIAIARVHAPATLRAFPSNFYIEGWATYAADFLGERLEGNTEFEVQTLWNRASMGVQALLDLVVHVVQPTEAEALAVFERAYGLDGAGPALAARMWYPGYDAGYFLGAQEFRTARERVREREGAAFSDKSFHERVLKLGPVRPSRIVALLGREAGRSGK